MRSTLLIVALASACSLPSFSSKEAAKPEMTTSGLRPGSHEKFHPGSVLPGAVNTATAGAVLVDGDYVQTVLQVLEASGNSLQVAAGERRTITLKVDPDGTTFLDEMELVYDGNAFTGEDVFVEEANGLDCRRETGTYISGIVVAPNRAFVTIREGIAVMGKECAYSDWGQGYFEALVYEARWIQ